MKKNTLLFLLIIAAAFSGCYYDNVEELHPYTVDKSCSDTAGVVAFNQKVKPIIDTYCGTVGNAGDGCHGANSGAGISLTTYAEVKSCANSTSYTFLKDIQQASDANSNMPKGGGKLTDCQIKVIENWISQGMLEN